LTAVKFVERIITKSHYFYKWECVCDCGNSIVIDSGNLRTKQTQSCGCISSEVLIKRNTTHGMRKTRFNNIWRGIKKRCKNPNEPAFPRYGARGIKVEWKTFEEFRDDMYESYLEHVKEFGEKNTSIDRIDNDGNYSKENCRWATVSEQNRNKRNNRLITFKGETKCVAEWAEELGFPEFTIYDRLNSGWTTEDALTKPIRGSISK